MGASGGGGAGSVRPVVLPAPRTPLVNLVQILDYAKLVAADNSSTPASPGAVLPRELLAAHARLAAFRGMVTELETTLLRARADARRAVDMLEAGLVPDRKRPEVMAMISQARDVVAGIDTALLRARSDAKKAIDA